MFFTKNCTTPFVTSAPLLPTHSSSHGDTKTPDGNWWKKNNLRAVDENPKTMSKFTSHAETGNSRAHKPCTVTTSFYT
uniref:Uncharacterized protein n=1 Tax=Amphiprion percula TaxID=161767 RepID=A0A3P8STM7_AMPPE